MRAKILIIPWGRSKKSVFKEKNQVSICIYFEIKKWSWCWLWIHKFVYKDQAKFLLPINADIIISWMSIKQKFRIKSNRVLWIS